MFEEENVASIKGVTPGKHWFVATETERKELLSILRGAPSEEEIKDALLASFVITYRDGSSARIGINEGSVVVMKDETRLVLRNDGSILAVLKAIESRLPKDSNPASTTSATTLD